MIKNLPQCRRPGSIPGSGRSPGGGKGYPLQYSRIENSMACIVHGVAESQTILSNFHYHYTILYPQRNFPVHSHSSYIHNCQD